MATNLCDECGKNKATVHLTEIINDQVTKLNLCEACAKQKGSDVEQHFGIADLLSALTDSESHAGPAGSASAMGTPSAPLGGSKTRCPACNLAYEDFKKMGRLGCSECYTAFKTSLQPLLKRIHGAIQHLGKSPDPSHVKEMHATSKVYVELEAAKAELDKAVKNEEFEEAASLRDKIKYLEKKLKDTAKESKI